MEEILAGSEAVQRYHTILEYELPLESRRPDVIFLVQSAVVVLELTGKQRSAQGGID